MIVPLVVAALLFLMLVPSGNKPEAAPRPFSRLERKPTQLERRLADYPGDRGLRRATIKAWFKAGHWRIFRRPIGVETIPTGIRDDLADGLRHWDAYFRQTGGEGSAEFVETAANTSMEIAEIGSRDPRQVEVAVERAARASEIAGERNPILYTLSNTAIYAYFNGEFKRGDVAATGAADDPENSKRLKQIAIDQLEAYRERGEAFRRLLREAKAELRDSGDELLDEPLKAFVHLAGLNKEDPETDGPDA